MNYILTIQDYLKSDRHHELGGKAANLFYLQTHGVTVPDLFCISSCAFKDHIQPITAEIAELLRSCAYDDSDALNQVSLEIKHLIKSIGLSASLKTQLANALSSLGSKKNVSVRSSAANEDGLKHSFAGQLQTWLNVPTKDVEEKVIACWCSAFSPGVLSYMHRLQLQVLHNPVAVIIQHMVEAKSSGVMFQADPRGHTHRQVICAAYGLGEGVVADKADADTYCYDGLSSQWNLEITEKQRYSRIDKHDGVKIVSVPLAWRKVPVLNDAQREQLLRQSSKIASLYDHYQDIEWTFDASDQLYILQSRAITTVMQGYHRVFDNSNIMESYPGIVLPMTFSILHLDYYHCIKNALRRLGASASIVTRHDTILRDLVGYLYGRSYYNIVNWYRILLLIPFFKGKIIKYFQQMIGSEATGTNQTETMALSSLERLRLAILFPVKFIVLLFRHDALVQEYFRRANALHDAMTGINLESCSADELIGHLQYYPRKYMECLSIPIINDLFSMTFMAATRAAFKRKKILHADSLLNRLLAHQHIESIKPLQSVQTLALLLVQSPARMNILQTILQQPEYNNAGKIVTHLNHVGETELASAIRTHIDQFAYRCPRELIMEADTYQENPYQLIRTILSIAEDAKEKLAVEVQSDPLNLSPLALKSTWLRWLVHKTRKTIACREATRLDRSRLFAKFRTFIRQLGSKLVREGVLDQAQDVFLFTLDELEAYRKACTANTDLRALANYRRKIVADWQAHHPQSQVYTTGLVYANKIPDKSHHDEPDAHEWLGAGCSPGQVTAAATIVFDPNQAKQIRGKILVTETTDPGWVFLMTIASGLICERGSLLSHTAIVGRELGVPTIVGLKNATKLIDEGEIVTMDGATGRVSICASNLTSQQKEVIL